MPLIKARWSGTLVVLIALVVAAFAYVDAQDSSGQTLVPASSGVFPVRSPQASEVEAAIVRTNLAARIESALGKDFAGLWFEPSTARLHVGAASSAARLDAEAVVARVGLTDRVTETPVRSTWEQLESAQERWGNRLDDLFDRSEVATALSARRNAVTIELGSAVPSARRVALERAAAANWIEVLVDQASHPHLGIVPQARCAAFVPKKTVCDPTIVGGVTIRGPIVAKGEIEESEEGEDFEEEEFIEESEGFVEKQCTAGPAVKVKDPPDGATATKTYILTAGHCVDPARGGGGVGGKWNAFNKKAVPEEKEVGATVAFIHNLMDVGVIEVTTAYWAKAKDPTPVIPASAAWAAGETEPLPVIQQANPVEKMRSCVSGQTSGFSCGEIITLDQTTTVNGVKKTNLTEVKGATTAGGDSGGPWIAEAEYKKGTAFVEGTHVGTKGKTGNPVFQPLSVTLPELKKQKGLDLELLTEKNKTRHPPVLTGSQPSGNTTFTTTAGSVKCTGATYLGSSPGGEVSEFELVPTYSGCTAFGVFSTTIDVNGCTYRFKVTKGTEGTVDLVCPAGKELTATVSSAGTVKCTINVPSQNGLGSVKYTNVGSGATREVTMHLAVTGVHYSHVAGTGLGKCTSGSAVNGTLEATATVTAESGEEHVGIFVP